jgi:hypothetical protein
MDQILLFSVVQAGFGTHPVSYPMGSGGSLLELKRQRRETDHLLPSNVVVNNAGPIYPLPDTSSWHGA